MSGTFHLRQYPWRPAAVCLALTFGAPGAFAQTASPIGAFVDETQPRTAPDVVVKPAAPGVRSGPLAPWATAMADRGLTFGVNVYNFYQANPSAGLRTGEQSNSTYFVLSMSADMQKLAGLSGGSINFTQSFFGFVRNPDHAVDIGDSTVGYQPPFNINNNRLSLLTYQQKLLDDRLVVEVGRTHPDRYYGLPPCGSINSCFQDLFYLNAGFTSPLYGVWGANIAYKLSPTTYIQAGAFSVNPGTNALSGYDFGYETLSGALVMTEIGRKTDFTVEAYPGRVSLTGFYNTSDHADNLRTIAGTSRGLNPGTPAIPREGTSGIVLTGSQTVWRADQGRVANPTPTAISLYTGTGYAFDSTIPIRFNTFVGATLSAPDQSRPGDSYGIKMNWQRINDTYATFLADANRFSGGSGASFSRDKLIFEANANFALGRGIAFQPVVQYLVNGTSFFNPYTARRPKDGFYVGTVLVVPLGALFGLSAI